MTRTLLEPEWRNSSGQIGMAMVVVLIARQHGINVLWKQSVCAAYTVRRTTSGIAAGTYYKLALSI